MQTVYGDILFFVNFCMDFQCLFLTARLLHRPFHLWRCVLAAAGGALYACAALFLSVTGAFAFLADCGVCYLMCALAFGSRTCGLRRVTVPFALYFGVSLAVGGVMSGMATLLSRVELPHGGDSGGMSDWGFFFLAALGGAVTFLWGRLCQRRAKGQRAVLTVRFEGKKRQLDCMVDTANLLRDPVSGRPVALVDVGAVKGFFPESLLAAARDPIGIADLPCELSCRTRLIPAGTATGKGLLLAVMPDSALLDAGRGPCEVSLLLALTALEGGAADDRVLLPAALITE